MKDTAAIASLDGIRALAVGLVFFAHGGLEQVVPGGLGVTIFFVLSGYLITTLMRREHRATGGVRLRAFYLRRLLRLMPPLVVVVAAAALLSALGLIGGAFSGRGLLAVLFYFGNYHVIALDFQGLPEGLGVVWSLAVEEHYYLLYPPLAIALLRLGNTRVAVVVLAVLCLAMLAWRYWLALHGATDHYLTMATDTRADAILAGCILAFWRNPALEAVDPIAAMGRSHSHSALGDSAVGDSAGAGGDSSVGARHARDEDGPIAAMGRSHSHSDEDEAIAGDSSVGARHARDEDGAIAAMGRSHSHNEEGDPIAAMGRSHKGRSHKGRSDMGRSHLGRSHMSGRDWALGAACVLLLIATLAYRDDFFRVTARYTLQSLAIAPLIWLAVARAADAPFRWLNTRPLAYIGSISYTIYLSHQLILFGVERHAPALGGMATLALTALLTLAVAEPMRRWVEQPCARLRRQLHRRANAPVAGCASLTATAAP